MSNTIRNTVIGTAAAVAVGTGIYFAVNSNDIENIEIIDVISEFNVLKEYESEFKTNEYDLGIKTVADNEFNLGLNTNSTDLNLNVSRYNLNTSTVDSTPGSNLNNLSSTGFIDGRNKIQLSIENIQSDLNGLNKLATYVNDHRNFPNGKLIQDWVAILNRYEKSANINFVKLNNVYKIIAEVRLPKTETQWGILNENLIYYKSQNYNAVLIVFNTNEDIGDYIKLVKYIKDNYKLSIFFAYSETESLTDSKVLVDPLKLGNYLNQLGSICDGYLLSWRRTSSHLFTMSDAWMKFAINKARESNNNLPIIGELFYGEYIKNGTSKYGWSKNIPTNVSAVVIMNRGFSNVNISKVVEMVTKKFTGIEFIGCVVGPRPYYLTENKIRGNWKKFEGIKNSLIKEFQSSGCKTVIIMHDDGRDGHATKSKLTNNLSETLYSEMNGVQ